MLYYAALFFIVAVVTFLIGFLGNLLTGGAIMLAKVFFVLFFALFVITLVIDIVKRKKGNRKK
jgi:uncharacterized membrane protein YtjA (UPF0391 family)